MHSALREGSVQEDRVNTATGLELHPSGMQTWHVQLHAGCRSAKMHTWKSQEGASERACVLTPKKQCFPATDVFPLGTPGPLNIKLDPWSGESNILCLCVSLPLSNVFVV